MGKNPPAMQETWVRSLSWEDPLEKGMATPSSILAWRISGRGGAWHAVVHGLQRVRHDQATFTSPQNEPVWTVEETPSAELAALDIKARNLPGIQCPMSTALQVHHLMLIS